MQGSLVGTEEEEQAKPLQINGQGFIKSILWGLDSTGAVWQEGNMSLFAKDFSAYGIIKSIKKKEK